MLAYQTQYVKNVRQIAALRDLCSVEGLSFADWYQQRQQAEDRLAELRQENLTLLSDHLFARLDDLHNATAEEIAQLEAFADELMDWKTNLDCGVYVLIHDSLLSLYRVRRDRDGIIKELYKLGMGLYYLDRSIQGIRKDRGQALYFENEMVFTEAGSYLKFFEQIENEQTKGYIIRALANIAICAKDVKRKIAVSGRILEIVRDDYYRNLAPGLPWDVFLRRTEQQMSSNRNVLSKGDLTTQELAAVLEACQAVFEPESQTDTPNIRWLWPYYEMEYSCGFVDLKTTLDRMEHLILGTKYDQYDVSGMYANVQLPIYYGRLLRNNPNLQNRSRYVRFLAEAYEKMIRTLLTYPTRTLDDFFFYNLCLVVTDYYEAEGVPLYRDLVIRLMERFDGMLFLKSLRVGRLLKLLCRTILQSDPAFFDDIPFLRRIDDPGQKEHALLEYAGQCALFYDFGLMKMNLERISRTRNLLEREYEIYKLHPVSGYDDLRQFPSTERFADIAYGHHSWYNGAGGYPEDYVRNESPYRQMTDLVAVTVYMTEHYQGEIAPVIGRILAQEGKRFSPLITPFLEEPALQRGLEDLLKATPEADYRILYDLLTQEKR
ncbi:MAG: hypothetical protein IJ052_05380 [Oscillospiraceae bacterium]|nr:hypothetical protein [Oscillospiraceae bacterium]